MPSCCNSPSRFSALGTEWADPAGAGNESPPVDGNGLGADTLMGSRGAEPVIPGNVRTRLLIPLPHAPACGNAFALSSHCRSLPPSCGRCFLQPNPWIRHHLKGIFPGLIYCSNYLADRLNVRVENLFFMIISHCADRSWPLSVGAKAVHACGDAGTRVPHRSYP
jgi:hypothetical protein